MKKRISLFLIFAMLITLLVPLAVTTVSADEPTLITDQASFVSAIATNSTKDADGKATGTFKLANDITISGEWNFTTVFRGELDGNGHTITFADGATITSGLFAMVSANAYIHDLSIVQAGSATWVPQTASGCVNACLGGVVGLSGAGAVNGTNSWGNKDYTSSADNKVRIENVTVTVNMDVTGSTPNASVGGIVGEIGLYTEITNCVFNGYISDATNRYDSSNGDSKSSQDGGNSSRSAYGGIVGFGFRQAVVVITECINNGNITGYGQEGGILGAISPAWNANETFITTTIQRCINNGTITCNGTDITSSVAGIAAYLYGRRVAGTTVNVLNNINNGTIAKAEGDAYIAGIVARVNRKEDKNVVTFAGNLQLSEDVGGGSQIMNHADGSGDDGVLVYTNNFGRSAGNSTYSPLSDAAAYEAAYETLNAAYPDVYTYRENKIMLAWVPAPTEPEEPTTQSEEPTTEPVGEDATTAPTTTEPVTTAPDDGTKESGEKEKKKGCKSSVGIGGAVALVMVLGGAGATAATRRKED